jgi:hypothetical protein
MERLIGIELRIPANVPGEAFHGAVVAARSDRSTCN